MVWDEPLRIARSGTIDNLPECRVPRRRATMKDFCTELEKLEQVQGCFHVSPCLARRLSVRAP